MKLSHVAVAAVALFTVACTPSQPTATPAPPASPAAAETTEVTPTPPISRIFFVEPEDGATVTSPVMVKMGVEGMEVKPAGPEDVPNTGHHHLVVDGGPVPAGEPVPADASHIHFGKGQTETEVELTPGEHTLTLQFANHAHISYGPEMSATIKVKVEE